MHRILEVRPEIVDELAALMDVQRRSNQHQEEIYQAKQGLNDLSGRIRRFMFETPKAPSAAG